nr:PREDICTED: uncharacterized protein LOC107399001 [Tribolium castaneum]|eukprot:XP_015840122.1 PREDICTED: uncharacterized protein LOC107399001 [Tribolium castaneum]
MDHLPKLISSVCSDSEIAKRLKLSRRKGTVLMKDVVRKEQMTELTKTLKNIKFSLIIDETTDTSTFKCLVLIARFYCNKENRVLDKFWGLVRLKNCTSQGIFDSINQHFLENNVPITNLIGLAADNATVMMGAFNGVQAKLRELVPDLYVLGCSCHSLNLCSTPACLMLPTSVEKLTKDIHLYFAHSSKRTESFEEFQTFTNVESHKVLKLAQTRWLSLGSVVKRILEQWPALVLFFQNEADVENVPKAKLILQALSNPIFKLYFQFLAFILDIINQINVEFQSEKYKLHVLLNRLKNLNMTKLFTIRIITWTFRNCIWDQE